MSNSLGSYYVSLGMQADHDSFNKAKQSSDNVSNSIARLVGTVRNSSAIIAAGLGALSVGAASTAAKNIEAASAMGISAKALKDWGTVARLAGKDVKGFQNEMAGLSEKFTMEKNGHGDAIGSVYTHFGQLLQRAKETTSEFNGMSTEVWRKMDTGEQTRLVFRMAQAVKDQQSAAMHIQNILGSTGASLYTYMKTSGKSIDGMLKEARKLSFYDEEKAQKAAGFSDELSRTGAAGKNIAEALGVSIGAELTPVLKRLNDFLYNNQDDIQKTLDAIADGVGKVVGATEKIAKWIAPKIGVAVENTKNFIDSSTDIVNALKGITDGHEKIREGEEQGDADAIAEGKRQVEENKARAGKKILGEGLYNDRQKEQDEINKWYAEEQEETNKTNNGLLRGVKRFKNWGHKKLKEAGTEFKIWNARANNAQSLEENERIKKLSEQLVQLTMKGGTINKVNLNELPIHMRQEAQELGLEKFSMWIEPTRAIQDGIIRPNGQVTQVAPDDWVFAVRDIGNLSNALVPQKEPRLAMRSWDALLEEMQQGVKEFIPSTTVHNTTNAPQDIVINQTINISSSNEWLPQTIKEQAYTGTYDALQQAMRESRQRLELMTGMR